MSAPSYQPEPTAGRRPPPPPLRIQSRRTSGLGPYSPEPLLYDLPSVSLRSPPQSPDAVSPTSPTGFSGRSRIRSPYSPKTAARSNRAHSATSSRADKEIEAFAEACERWFFKQDEEAGQIMTDTLATLPAHQRAPYVKLQSAIRSAYHTSVQLRRDAEFHAHLSTTHSGASLSARARGDPQGSDARKERCERFQKFLKSWCTHGMPGTQPFFESLWAIMRLQVVPTKLGGAGGNRIIWEIDDAVFKEAGGKDFMLEAIDAIKGVLGFEELPTLQRSSTASSNPSPVLSSSPAPIPMQTRTVHPSSKPPVPARHSKRPRAPSDPFLDAPTPDLSRSLGSSSSIGSGAQVDSPPTPQDESAFEGRVPPRTDVMASSKVSGVSASATPLSTRVWSMPQPDCEDTLRLWLSPDLSDPELLSLLKLFPTFITRRTLPRFPSRPENTVDAERDDSEHAIRAGTGRIWVSEKERIDGWKGGWWSRIRAWWRRLFG